MLELIDTFDKQAIEGFLVSFHSPSLTAISEFISLIWPHSIWFGIILLLALFQNWRRAAVYLIVLGCALIVVGSVADFLKDLVARPRPITYLGVALDLTRDSFPSAHAANSFTVAFVTNYFYRKVGIFVSIVALLVALSRFFQLLHYPSDIFIGAGIAVLLSASLIWSIRYLCNRLHFTAALSYLSMPAAKPKPPAKPENPSPKKSKAAPPTEKNADKA